MTAAVTPLEALRRLIAVAKWPDAHWFSSEADWNEYQGELGVAEMVVRDAAAPVVPVAAQPLVQVPGLEFVQAIANNFDSHDRENDEIICRGCSAPELWIEESKSYLITHRPECIVLRARAFLAAPHIEAQPAGEVERDAARYRWLRDKANGPIDELVDRFDPMVFRCHPKHPLCWDGVSVGAELDDVVDCAMAQGDKA